MLQIKSKMKQNLFKDPSFSQKCVLNRLKCFMTLEPILVLLMKTFFEKFKLIKDPQKLKKPQFANFVLLEIKIFKLKANFSYL
jgi:hypothetical protein